MSWQGIVLIASVLTGGLLCFLLNQPEAGYSLVGAAVGLIAPSPVVRAIPPSVKE